MVKKQKGAKKSIIENVKAGQEEGARRAILEDLFYDFNSSKKQVFLMNFFRGIFLGFGTAIGGTLVVALLIWILTAFVNIPGGIGEFVRSIVETVNQGS